MALVVTLAILVLLTFLVVAFLDKSMFGRRVSSSSNNQIRANELARSAVEFVESQLTSEIRDPGKSTPLPAASPSVYLPKAAANQLPENSGIPTGSSVNLVKMSSNTAGGTLYTGGRAVSSSSSPLTSVPSGNGRTLDSDYWFGSRGPRLGTTASNAVPAWMYVTKSGGVEPITFDPLKHTAGGPSEVIGRFSFVLYDTGSLLDLNMAGAPAATEAKDRAIGGSLGLADLTALGLTQAQVDTLLKFRTPDLWNNPAEFLKLLFRPAGETNFHPSTKGFLATKAGHRPFFSRGQLIRFWQTQGWDENLLQKLSHLSLDIEAPSFDPVILSFPGNSTSTNYGRSAYAAYSPPGSSAQTVSPPQRIAASPTAIKKRFPLERLSWLEAKVNNPSDTSRDSDIQKAFGLTWNSADKAWDYVDGDVSNGLAGFKIKTLAEVAAVKPEREPNFFETLKAAIYPGSLGSSNPYHTGDKALMGTDGPVPAWIFDRNSDLQIIRIGANIIDQWDADSFPTEINVNTVGFYGTEDLPYISELVAKVHRTDSETRKADGSMIIQDLTDHPNAQIFYYLCFELWNPHQPSPNTSSQRPSNIRIRALAGNWHTKLDWNSDGGNGASYKSPGVTTYTTAFNGSQAIYPISKLAADSFRSPAFPSNASDGSFVSDFGVNGIPLTPLNQLKVDTPPKSYTSGLSAMTNFWRSSNTVFVLEYQRDGVWKAYASFGGFPDNPSVTGWNNGLYSYNYDLLYAPGVGFDAYSCPFNVAKNYMGLYCARYMNLDPRSNRFGGSRGDPFWMSDSGLGDNQGFMPMLTRRQLTADQSGRPPVAQAPNTWMVPSDWYNQHPEWGIKTSTSNWSGAFGIMEPRASAPDGGDKFPGLLYQNDASSTVINSRVPDPDNVTRPADGILVPASNNPSARTWSGSLPGGQCASTARPIILNRPFRSVGELGYAYRDQPWKTLDLFTDKSADAAVLDYFCINELDATGQSDNPPLAAGRVSLNTPHKEVIKSLIKGIAKAPWSDPTVAANVFSDTEADTIATKIITSTSTTPIRNRAELAALLNTLEATPGTLFGKTKAEREAVVRALGQVGQTRTWNFLLDVTAQSGRIPKNATGADKFVVEAQKRYWVEIAVDRFTGNVVRSNFTLPVD